jgi:hypothetical protein
LIFSSVNFFRSALDELGIPWLYFAQRRTFAKSFFPEASSAFPHRGPSKISHGKGFSLTLELSTLFGAPRGGATRRV